MTEPFGAPRRDLLALDEEILVAMSNRGLVKRARKDIDAGAGPLLDSGADGDGDGGGGGGGGGGGTVRGRFPDGAVATFPPAAGLDAGVCTCAAPGICRHRICLVLTYQQAHSGGAPADPGGAGPGLPQWSPGDVDDETLAALVGAGPLRAARKTFARGYAARVHRASAREANCERSDSAPWVELPACTVRFPVPGEAAHALTDATTARRGEVIALAIWAFRAADATRSTDDLVRVEVGGDAAPTTDPANSTNPADPTDSAYSTVPADPTGSADPAKQEQPGSPKGGPGPAEPPPPVARAFTEALDVTLNLLIDGGAHADAVLSSTLFQVRHDLSAARLHWPAAAFGEIIDQLSAYQSRGADYQHVRLARAVAELHARHRALGRAPLPAADILGTGESEAVLLRRTRLTALGARIRGGRTSRTAHVYFAQPQAGITLVLKRQWAVDPDDGADPPAPTGAALAARRILGATLGALATANLVSETATRSPSRVLTVSHSRIAPTAVLPVGAAWSELREPILVGDLRRFADEFARQPPSFLRPRIEAEAVRLIRVAQVSEIGYDVAEQSLRAVIRDERGTCAALTATYDPVCPGALDALADALAAEPRYISGVLSMANGRLVVDPMALMTGRGVIVPDFAPGDGSRALAAAAGSPPGPIAAALAAGLDCLAELASVGMRLAGRGAMAGVEECAARLARIGLADCAARLRAVPDALREHGYAAAAERWIDAFIQLSVAAEIN